MASLNKQSGLIRLLVLIIIGIIILSVFKIDLRGLLDSEVLRANFSFVWGIIKNGLLVIKDWWFTYAQGPITALNDHLMNLWQKGISLLPNK